MLNLELSEYQTFSPLIEEDIYERLMPLNVVDSRNSYGGTGRVAAMTNIMEAQDRLLELVDFFI